MSVNQTIIRGNLLRATGGDADKALWDAAWWIDYYRANASAGFLHEPPSHSIRPPRDPVDAILTPDGK